MEISEAAKLRLLWKAKGNPPCNHPAIEGERTESGRETGLAVCTTCGAEIKFAQE